MNSSSSHPVFFPSSFARSALCTIAGCLAFAWPVAMPASARGEATVAPKTSAVDAQVVLNAYQGLVEEHVSGVLRAIRVIAISNEATSAEWMKVKPMLDRFGADLETEAAVWFALPDGSYFSTSAEGVTDQNLRDRSYFPALMAGRDVEGELVISKSTGHRSVIVATPVTKDGKVVAAIGVSLRLRLISQLVENHTQLPDEWYFYSLTPDALISTHRNIDRMFKHPTDIGDESLGPRFAESLATERGRLDYPLHGKTISAIFQKSKNLNWHFFIARQSE